MLSAFAILVLAVYPEGWAHTKVGGLFTIAVGILCLFVPLRALGAALIPYQRETPGGASSAGRRSDTYRWGLVALAGVLVGAIVAIVGEGGGTYHGRLVLVFVSVEVAGLLTGYTLLQGPLELFRACPVPVGADRTALRAGRWQAAPAQQHARGEQ